MKINEYNDMMSYLTRKGNTSISGGPVLKSSNTARQRLAKGTTSDTKPAPKNSKMDNWVNDNVAMYESDTYFNKSSPKYYNKKSKPIDPVKINIDIIPELERPDPLFDEQERQFKQILAEQKQKESDKWTTGLASFHRKKY